MAHGIAPFNALYTFVITAKHLNLTNAAKELFVTQGAVSRQIATLESYLGFKVFTRHARGLYLTPKGEALLPDIKKAFGQIKLTTEKAMKPTGEIRFKAPSCPMRWLVPKLLAFQKAYPDIHVALTTTHDHGINFANEDFDIGLVYDKNRIENDHSIKLYDEFISPVIAADKVESGVLPDLSNHTLVHPTKDHTDWNIWLNAKGITEFDFVNNQYFDTMEMAISAAIQGFGIAIADVNLVQEDLNANRLVQPFPLKVKTGASYYLVLNDKLDKFEVQSRLVNWLSSEALVL